MKHIHILLLILLFSYAADAQVTPDNSSDAPPPPPPPVHLVDSSPVFEFTAVEQQPEFPGGMQQLYKFLQKNLRYPEMEKEMGIQGKIFLKFVIKKDGSIGDVSILKGVPNGPGLEKEAMRVIKMMPAWSPARQNGKAVNIFFVLPISFKLNDGFLEASFPGGKPAIDKYIYENIKYPKDAKKEKIEGYVTVSFEIDTTGKVVNATVLESLGHGCDEEALRLVNNMPKWTPGKDQVENTKSSVRIKFQPKK